MKVISALIGAAVIVLVAATVGLTTGGSGGEREVALDKVPAAVRATIKKHAAGGTIREIEAEREDDRLVYEVEVVRDGRVFEFVVSAAGEYLRAEDDDEEEHGEYGHDDDDDDDGDDDDGDGDDDDDDGDGDDDDEDWDEDAHWVSIDFADVPAAAQKVVQEYAPTGAITEVERSDAEDVPVFEVEYLIDEAECSIVLTADGEIMKLEQTISMADLPPAILNELEEDLPDVKVVEVETVQLFFYKLEITVDGEEHDVFAFASGDLKGDEDDDEDDDEDEDDDWDEDDDDDHEEDDDEDDD